MTTKSEEWDSYYCRVDDRAASIFLGFAYRDERLVMNVIELASKPGGDYDGWGAPIADGAN